MDQSHLLGPEREWAPVPVEAFDVQESLFWELVEQIILSFPGTYDDVPWPFTEMASQTLMSR